MFFILTKLQFITYVIRVLNTYILLQIFLDRHNFDGV